MCPRNFLLLLPLLGAPAEAHSSIGVITGFGDQNRVIIIKHKAFPDGFMQAMEMSFSLQDAKMADGFKVGDRVAFTLQRSGEFFPIVSLSKI